VTHGLHVNTLALCSFAAPRPSIAIRMGITPPSRIGLVMRNIVSADSRAGIAAFVASMARA
jgi:hypothetical protein